MVRSVRNEATGICVVSSKPMQRKEAEGRINLCSPLQKDKGLTWSVGSEKKRSRRRIQGFSTRFLVGRVASSK